MPSAEFGRIHSRIPVERFAFDFTSRRSALLRPLGVGPETSVIFVGDGLLDVRFGPWRVLTPLTNISAARVDGPDQAWRVPGVRLAWADRTLTFDSGSSARVCIRLHDPVPGIDPLGAILHPTVTVTVSEPEALARSLCSGLDPAGPERRRTMSS